MCIFKTKKNLCLLFLLSFFLFMSIVINSRIDYNDSWILGGLYLPIIVYTSIFVYYFEIETNLLNLVAFSSIFVLSLSLIPGLKYELFYGTAIDQNFHFRFIQDIVAQSTIPQGRLYSEIPLMHLFLSCFTLITGSSPISALKYGLPLAFGTLPFVFYSISKTISSNYSYIKYSILASTIPLTSYYYIIGGTSFAILIILFFFLLISKEFLFDKNMIKYTFLLLVFVSALVLAHSFTPLILSITLSTTGLFYYLINKKNNDIHFKLIQRKIISTFFILIMSLFAYWIYRANFFFKILVSKLYEYTFSLSEPKAPIPSRFFEISILSKIQVLIVYHIADFILFTLAISGIYLFYLMQKKDNELNRGILFFFIFYFAVLSLILLLVLATKMGDLEYTRLIAYKMMVSPILVGITFVSIRRVISRNLFFVAIITMIFALSFLQFYSCQPLIPKVIMNNESEDYLVDVNLVNSIYQIQVLEFIRTKSPAESLICGDKLTLNQMYGFMDYTFFQNHVIWYIVEDVGIDKSKFKYDFYVTHRPGKAGNLFEQYEYRNENFVLSLVNKVDLIYSNGESFVLKGKVD